MKNCFDWLIVLALLSMIILFQSCSKEANSTEPNSIEPNPTEETPPGQPTLSSPPDNASNVELSPILSWNSSEGATSYTLQVSRTSTLNGGNFAFNQSGLSETNQLITGLYNSTTYFWRVKATNDKGASAWSGIRSFTIVPPSPDAPVIVSPGNGKKDVLIPPTLVWNPVGSATSYTLQVSKSSQFSSFAYNLDGTALTNIQLNILNPGTKYYWRVRATNNYGTSEWSTASFKTFNSCPGYPSAFTYEGKTYHPVQIGSQCWLKENLDVGKMITGGANQTDNGSIDKWCYDNLQSNCDKYGGLYQWWEAMQYNTNEGAQGICPLGWHIATYADYLKLESHELGNGNALKEAGEGSGNGSGTNTSGFSAVLAGNFGFLNFGFNDSGKLAHFWNSTVNNQGSVDVLYLNSSDNNINFRPLGGVLGLSVRCIKD